MKKMRYTLHWDTGQTAATTITLHRKVGPAKLEYIKLVLRPMVVDALLLVKLHTMNTTRRRSMKPVLKRQQLIAAAGCRKQRKQRTILTIPKSNCFRPPFAMICRGIRKCDPALALVFVNIASSNLSMITLNKTGVNKKGVANEAAMPWKMR